MSARYLARVFQRFEDFETLTFVLLGLLFEAAERLRPQRPLDRRRHLRHDLVALVVLIAGVNASRAALRAGFGPQEAGFDAGLAGALAWLRGLHPVPKIALGLVLIDLSLYGVHRAMHASSLLWRTHAWHHSVEALYWFSGLRTSLGHALLFAIPQVFWPFFVFRLSLLEAAAGFSIGIFIQFWEHANVRADLGPLRWVVVTPGYHRVHHSATALQHKNLAIMFPVWDLLFGTYVDPRSVPDDVPTGLGDGQSSAPTARLLVGV